MLCCVCVCVCVQNYDRGLYSAWISDSYSDAEYICVLDPDTVFTTRAALLNMLQWDEEQRIYKPSQCGVSCAWEGTMAAVGRVCACLLRW